MDSDYYSTPAWVLSANVGVDISAKSEFGKEGDILGETKFQRVKKNASDITQNWTSNSRLETLNGVV